MSKIYNGALELVGNTPLVEVKNIEEELGLEARILVKLYHSYYAGDNECRKKKHPESIRSRDCSDRRRKGNEGCD